MTAQIPETIIFEGEKRGMCSEPLETYLQFMDMEDMFEAPHTACWRGYVGTWEVIGERLYLVEFEGDLKSGGKACLETIFPGFPDRVFAHWFSDTVRLPQGKMLEYVHGGYASTYEQDLFLEFESGVLKALHVHVNGVSDDPEGEEGYGVAAFTAFGND